MHGRGCVIVTGAQPGRSVGRLLHGSVAWQGWIETGTGYAAKARLHGSILGRSGEVEGLGHGPNPRSVPTSFP
jgi:hypothetical protein